MRTLIKYRFLTLILLFIFSGKIFSQENNKGGSVPYYMINPDTTKVLKSIKSYHCNNFNPLDDACHTYNGDTIVFMNNGISTIGSQVSPDISVPQAPIDPNETTCDPSIAIDPMYKCDIFTAAAAYIESYKPYNDIDQEIGIYSGHTWHWTGGINQSTYEGRAWFNPAVGLSKRGDTIFTGNVMAYYYQDPGGNQFSSLGQGISYSTDEGNSWMNTLIEFAYLGYNPDFYNYFLSNNHLAIDNNIHSPYYERVYSAWTQSATSGVISDYL